MKNKEDYTTKQAILNAALDLMKDEGIKRVTIRKIAKIAGVNVALINYYFGSKENLISEAIQSLLTSLKDTFTIFDDPSLTSTEQIKGFLLQYARIFQQYPFIAHMVMQENPLIFKSQMEYFNFLNAIGMKKFKNAISEASGEKDPKRLTIMMSHLIGATLLPNLIDPIYEYVTGYPFSNNIETPVDILIQQYFSKSC